MAIVHIVLFEWKPTVTQEQVEQACNRMLAFRETCLHPTTKKPYLKSCSGGRNNSPEGHAGGYTHGFVVEFEAEEDRDYYLTKDPEHLGFVKSAGELIQNVKVLDFEPGKL
ncbi:dabb-domain-containing protein [Corynespora cassiicola Philippines]|uniref:Dabb-domain-containing protein n=1 Tax=Corynespora cassiicola Philippines TaxID=1448308 RepID=A0A2T2NDM4_CORCC|nr:dabb-domain-containing protein [Corynespora cassiicola Philippines]